jgi:Flp pilus assembly protein TadD
MARRQDVHTLRAYAWALCASGRPAEGLKQMDRALEVGIRDAGFYYHAGVIAERSGDVPAARRHLRASLDLASQSEWSDRAEAALARLDGAPVRLAAPLAEQK